jgi:glutamine synthetase
VNSYRRLVPGYEAPVNLAYSLAQSLGLDPHPDVLGVAQGQAHRGSLPRPELQPVPRVRGDADGRPRRHPEQDRPGDPLDKDIYSLSPEELARTCPTCPARSTSALEALEKDHEFLLKGDVFTKDLLEEWVSYKRQKEVDPVRLRPTPLEFQMYYDV